MAAVVSYFLGKRFDVWVILGIVFINALMGFLQELRAAGAIAALQRLTSPKAHVLRDGETREIFATEVVDGDIVVLEAGDRIPADARLMQAVELSVDESMLTGESVPVSKSTMPVMGGNEVPLGDRTNMVYMNTIVTAGRGRAVVVAGGMASEMGKIARDVSAAANEAPIQRRLAKFSRRLGLVILGLVSIVLAMGLVLGRTFTEMFYVAISLAVSAIPEGLPIVVSVLFAIGVKRMAKRKALIRRLPAVEALGGATVICTDKTGTLTRNEMTVQTVLHGTDLITVEGEGYKPAGALFSHGYRLEAPLPEGLERLMACARLCNNALLVDEQGQWKIIGDPTEGALIVLADKSGARADLERLDEIPFSSERKWMATLHRQADGTAIAFMKGALDRLLPMASHWMDLAGNSHPLDEDQRAWLLAESERLASRALRLLALGISSGLTATEFDPHHLQGRITLLGIVGMSDPPRPEAVEAIRKCQGAGIKVVMITGDHRTTGLAIARQLGIISNESSDGVVEGQALENMPDRELEGRVSRLQVYARVSPSHKLRIVQALQKNGHIVAMTGDGVNDAPAIAQADIGISMGIAGSEVAKAASGMVLADDNFATIVSAVEEGRTISDNLQKVIHYLITTSASGIMTITVALLTGLPLPLVAVQILWINLVTDGLFDKTLALEKAEPGAMQRAPRSPSFPLISKRALRGIFIYGSIMAIGTLVAFDWELRHGATLVHARTEAFTTLAAFQWFSAFVYRSRDESIFRLPLNPWMIAALGVALSLQLLAVYTPLFNLLLGTEPLSPGEFLTSIAIASSLLVISELYKLGLRRGRLGE